MKDWLGVSVFIVGFVIEVTADVQLAVFKHNYPSPSTSLHVYCSLIMLTIGEILKTGLWRHSRHPAHFGGNWLNVHELLKRVYL